MSQRTLVKSPPSYSFPDAPLLRTLTLYPFQLEAVKKMRGYLAAYSRKDTDGSGLVYMPTGTGKTAVIAALAQCIQEIKITLILVPRLVLRNQLARELERPIFNKLHLPPETSIKPIYCLAEEQQDDESLKDLPREAIIISTIQKLQLLRIKQPEIFDELINRADLIIFDEGHYEPALHWSDTVRHIARPRILFTATPFRNDLKNFDIDPDYGFIYSFHKAVSQNYVRKVEITDVTPKTTLSAAAFVSLVMSSYKTYSKEHLLGENARIIIRCDDAAKIEHIADALKRKKIKCIAVHETFKDNTGNGVKWKHVPNPREKDALVWIHQFKLIEGLDDHRFQLLSIFGDAPDSARPLIQQIGRIIRNPGREKHSKAYVLDTTGGILKKQWAGYLEHDKFVEQYGLQALDTESAFYKMLEKAQPPIYYLDGSFRTPLSLDHLNPDKDIQVPKKVNIYYKQADFNMQTVAQTLIDWYNMEDRDIAPVQISTDRCRLVSIRLKNSPFLADKYYREPKLCVTLVYLAGDYICYFDSENLTPSAIPGFGKPVDPGELRRLLAGQNSCQIRQVSLVNSSAAPDAVQRRSLLTYTSMERTPPVMDDPNYICTTAEACIDRDLEKRDFGIRRYVGFKQGRLSDGSWTKFYPLSEYERWLDEIVPILRGQSIPRIDGLSRYASVTAPPLETTADTAILETYAVADLYVTTKSGDPIDLSQMDNDITVKNKTFHVQANGKRRRIKIRYDEKAKKYRLEAPALVKLYESPNPSVKDIIKQLNDEQAFKVIPADRRVVYAGGAFHDPHIGLGDEYTDKQNAILDTIKSFAIFGKMTSEKGTRVKRKGTGWMRDNLFGLIDRLAHAGRPGVTLTKSEQELSRFFKNIDLLVCDDMDVELADFIMLQSMPADRQSVVFIHCKALPPRKGTKLSASGLAEVCSQVVKNLGELDNFARSTVDRAKKWDSPWIGTKIGCVTTRLRRGASSGKKAWERFRDAVENPNTRRETWLFLGNILSKKEFVRRLKLPKPVKGSKPRKGDLVTLQVLYELYSTLCTVRSRNCGLYIFCNP